MKKSLAIYFLVLMLAPCLALAATKKKVQVNDDGSTTTTTTQTTPAQPQTLTSSSSAVSFGRTNLKGLSLMASYDFADSLTTTNGGDRDIDKTFILGAEYQFSQFSPGLAAQIGGQYEFAREIHGGGGAQLSTWTPYAELVGLLTPQFALMGGLNYGFPSLTNSTGTIKGSVGFQFGGSFLASKNFAIDGRYRFITDTVSANNNSQDVKMSGLLMGARYMF